MNTDTQTTTPVILAKDLVKTYGNVHALKGMNLRVDSGEIVAFLLAFNKQIAEVLKFSA